MSDVIDAYCERTGPGLLAEPMNAVTNFSFIIAAWAAWSLASHSERLSPGVWELIALAASVGVGSLLWHTFATNWALWLDIVPIFLFIVWFIWMYTHTVAGMPTPAALAWVGAYVVATFLAQGFVSLLHGAPVHAPTLIVVLALGVMHAQQQLSERYTLLWAAALNALALLFRTIDQEICPGLPIGTHFLWHSLNGIVAYLAMRAVTRSGALQSALGRSSTAGPAHPSPAVG